MADLYKDYEPEVLAQLQKTELGILKDFCDLCERYDIDYFGVGGTGIGAVRHGGFIPWDDDIDIGLLRRDYDKFLKVAAKEMKEKYRILNAETDKNYPLMSTRLVLKGTEFREECFKDLPCETGIFLDLYCFDNISNNEIKMRVQGARAWFWGKLMVLCAVDEPVLYFSGWKKKVVLLISKGINAIFRLFKCTPNCFYGKAKKIITKYRGYRTERVAYFFDPTPYTSVISVADILPTKKMNYDGIEVRFPNNLEKYLEKRYGDFMKLPPEDKRHNHPPYKLDFNTQDNREEGLNEWKK